MLDRIHSERLAIWHAIWRLNEHLRTEWEHDRTTPAIAGRTFTHRVRQRLNERLHVLNRYERFYLKINF